ncbi:hypothetical protein [Streptomyces sp. NPDC048272]|uniref:hypothetical protein n=1 Tax=Streptomyces sp. NPDC048272 TaxID=3154616 RepID=UPI003446289A
MNEAYDNLVAVADRIGAEWEKTGNDCAAFPEIAWRETEGLDLSHFGELSNLSALLQHPEVSRLQRHSTFSDLYFMLYDNGHFWVEVLNWWGSDINIHDHDFSGVQMQLAGQSLNVKYDYVGEDAVDGLLGDGRITVKSAEIWEPGDRSFVRPGDVEPHTVNHLSIPTVSLLFRTHPVPRYGPQNNYFPPGIRSTYGIADINFRTNVKLLRVLARGDKKKFHETFAEVVATQTPPQTLFTLIKMTDILFHHEHIQLVRDFSTSGHLLAEKIVEAAAYHRATDFLINNVKRTPGLSDEQVFAVAVLGSVYDAESLKAILAQLEERGRSIDLRSIVPGILSHCGDAKAQEVLNVLRLFGLTEAFDLPASPVPKR